MKKHFYALPQGRAHRPVYGLVFYLAFSLVFGVAFGLAVAPAPASASAGEGKDAERKAEQTIVSAARIPQPLQEVLRPVSVLRREDIERSQAQDLAELLQSLPGLQFGRNGGRGALTSLFLRGSGSQQVLTLVDGVRISGASTGAAPWESLSVQQIERIEVVRGAHSALYGSDAIGGMVQIFTHSGGGDVDSLQIGAGSRSRIESQAHIARSSGAGWFSLNLGQSETGGIDHYRNAGADRVNADRDSFRELSLKFAAGRTWDNGMKLRADYLEMRNETEYDSVFLPCIPGSDAALAGADGCFGGRHNENLLSVGGLEFEFAPAGHWDAQIRLHRTRNDNKDPGRSIRTAYSPPDYSPTSVRDAQGRLIVDDSTTNFDTLRDSVSWRNAFSLQDGAELVFGADYYKERLDSAAYKRTRENLGLFAEHLLQAGAHSLALTGRITDNQQYGRQGAGGIDWGLRLRQNLLLTASVARAFRAPTFNDLYYPGGFANPDLQPEESLHRELSFKGEGAGRRWSLHVFRNDLEDAIVLDRNFVPQNAGDAMVQGAEWEYSGRWRDFTGAVSFTFLDPEEPAGPAFARRARRELKLRLDRRAKTLWWGTEFLARDHRHDRGRRLPGYALLAAYGGMQLHPEWRLQFRLSNLLDRDYAPASGYNAEGFGAFVSLTWRRSGSAIGDGNGAGRGI